MFIFFLMVLTLFITAYTSLFAYSLYKEKNKPGMTAVILLILAVIISPFLLSMK
ncbi:hypothetical protein SAMN05421663_102566 [Terribacillus halophilus]|uniref:Uncharacterized protein n=1 Tax=Terribacillus halophilus TaxID=361279 RepID=A0A1G6M1C3_9BACI|nr:hypothetical protein [Terribacillus halophilus]SDC49270.1 hypothetical protein SAMN05421663_102566 [Terribacillus halophilus]